MNNVINLNATVLSFDHTNKNHKALLKLAQICQPADPHHWRQVHHMLADFNLSSEIRIDARIDVDNDAGEDEIDSTSSVFVVRAARTDEHSLSEADFLTVITNPIVVEANKAGYFEDLFRANKGRVNATIALLRLMFWENNAIWPTVFTGKDGGMVDVAFVLNNLKNFIVGLNDDTRILMRPVTFYEGKVYLSIYLQTPSEEDNPKISVALEFESPPIAVTNFDSYNIFELLLAQSENNNIPMAPVFEVHKKTEENASDEMATVWYHEQAVDYTPAYVFEPKPELKFFRNPREPELYTPQVVDIFGATGTRVELEEAEIQELIPKEEPVPAMGVVEPTSPAVFNLLGKPLSWLIESLQVARGTGNLGYVLEAENPSDHRDTDKVTTDPVAYSNDSKKYYAYTGNLGENVEVQLNIDSPAVPQNDWPAAQLAALNTFINSINDENLRNAAAVRGVHPTEVLDEIVHPYLDSMQASELVRNTYAEYVKVLRKETN